MNDETNKLWVVITLMTIILLISISTIFIFGTILETKAIETTKTKQTLCYCSESCLIDYGKHNTTNFFTAIKQTSNGICIAKEHLTNYTLNNCCVCATTEE